MKRFGPAMATLALLQAAALAQPAQIPGLYDVERTETSLTMAWLSPGNPVLSYDLRYATVDLGDGLPSDWYAAATRVDGEPAPSAPGTEERVTIQGLRPATFYYFAITAADGAGAGPVSDIFCAMTSVPPPARVSDLEVKKLSQDYVTLTWPNPDFPPTTCCVAYSNAPITDANFNAIYAQHQSWRTTFEIIDDPGVQVTFKLTGLQMSTHYWIAIRSSDPSGVWSPVSNNVEAITLGADLTPPDAITDLDILEAYSEDHAAYLRCTVPEDQGGGDVWQIELKMATSPIDTDAKYEAATRVCLKDHWSGVGEAGTTVILPVSGLDSGTEYWFSARARDNSSLYSAISNADQHLTTPPDTTPPDPAILSPGNAYFTRATSVALGWSPFWSVGTGGARITFDLRYSTSPITEGNFSAATRDLSAETPGLPDYAIPGMEQHLVTGLTQQTTYYFVIKVGDFSGNWSAMSNVVTMTTLEAIPPDAITTLNVQSVEASHVWLEWKASGDDGRVGTASWYMIKGSRNDPATDPDWWSTAFEVAHAQVTGPFGTPERYGAYILLTGAEICWFAIKVVDDVGNESAISNIVRCGGYVGDLGLLQTGDLIAVKTLSKSVTLAWTAPLGARDYSIRYSTQSPGASMADWLNQATPALGMPPPGRAGTTESAKVEGLVPSTAYSFVRLAFDVSGRIIEYSEVLTVQTHAADPSPPAAIGDLAVALPQSTYLLLTWTAPGDDDRAGTAMRYELRWAPEDPGAAPTEEWWAHGAILVQNSTPVRGILPAPSLAGSREQVRIDGLTPETTYHFVIRAIDDDENWSPLVIPLAATTEPRDVVPPAAITTLRAAEVPGANDVVLTWQAEGEDGVGSERAVERYEIRYSTREPGSFESAASWWSHATPYVGETVPPLMPGTLQTATLRGLAPHQYFIAVVAIDEAPNGSDLSNVASIITFPIGSQEDGKVCSASARCGTASWAILAALSLWLRIGRRS